MQRIVYPILMTVFIALLTWIVWLTADVYVVGFQLTGTPAHMAYTASILFSALFVFSFASGRVTFAEKIRILYKLFNIAVGLFFYLSPAAFVLGLVFVFSDLSIDTTRILTTSTVVGSLILGIIGLLQARRIKITRYTVTLPDAPKSWDQKTAVLVSDTHFGLVKHKRFSKKIVSLISYLNPNFIIHAGDFYDGPRITPSSITDSWKDLSLKVPVFYAPGNHEHYGDYEAFIKSLKDIGWHVLVDEATIYDGVQISGLQYRSKTRREAIETSEILEKINLDRNMSSILINHPPTFHREAEKAGVSLMVSGHTHRGQFWPLNYLVWLLYRRYIYGIHKVQNMTAITTSGVGTAGPPTRLFNTPEIVVLNFKTK